MYDYLGGAPVDPRGTLSEAASTMSLGMNYGQTGSQPGTMHSAVVESRTSLSEDLQPKLRNSCLDSLGHSWSGHALGSVQKPYEVPLTHASQTQAIQQVAMPVPKTNLGPPIRVMIAAGPTSRPRCIMVASLWQNTSDTSG